MNNLDALLRDALQPNDSPSFYSNRKIIEEYKRKGRKEKMTKNTKKALVFVCVLLAVSMTVFAAWNLLTPAQVAAFKGDNALSAAFERYGTGKVQTQQFAEYNVSFCGIVSGDAISDILHTENGEVVSDRSYAVVAVEKADGTAFADMSEAPDLYVSPYVEGCLPLAVNIHTLHGNYFDCVVDGVMYRLLECDNIEMFADRTVWLGVNEGGFYESKGFAYDEASGILTRAEHFEGLNALFELPLDPAKADPAAAEAILAELAW